MKLNSDNLKIVLFDWDGTLAQSSPPRIEAVNRVLGEYGLPSWDKVKDKRDANLSFMDNFPNIFGSDAEVAYHRYCELYRNLVKDGLAGYPKAKEVILWLRSKGVKIAIMTNKDRNLLEFELPLVYPPQYFDKVVCGHEAPRDKPYGDHALYTLQGMIEAEDISPDKVWIVGDSQLDNLCADSINALPIRINHAPCDEDKINCRHTIYFDDYTALYNALKTEDCPNETKH